MSKQQLPKCFNRIRNKEIFELAAQIYEAQIKLAPEVPDNIKEFIGNGAMLQARTQINSAGAKSNKRAKQVQVSESESSGSYESVEEQEVVRELFTPPQKEIKAKPIKAPAINKGKKQSAKKETLFDRIINGNGPEIYQYLQCHTMTDTSNHFDISTFMVRKVRDYYNENK